MSALIIVINRIIRFLTGNNYNYYDIGPVMASETPPIINRSH